MTLFPSKYNYSYRINSKYSILNNFLTGALDIIENNIIDKSSISSLIERGYYYYDPDAENSIFEELFKNFQQKVITRPVKFVICPTFICNLNCIYCFEKDLNKKKEKFMDDEILERAIGTMMDIRNLHKKEISTIELFGGEPLLKKTKDLISKILRFSHEQKITISIITNGVMAKDFIDILIPVRENIEMLQITLDGPDFIHDKRRKYFSGRGSFKKISDSIDSLVVNGINTNVRVNVDMENIDYLPDIYEYAEKMKWSGLTNFKMQLSRVTDHSTLKSRYPIVEDHILLEKLFEVYNRHPHLENIFGFYMFKPLRHIIELLNGAENVSPRFFNCESNVIELYILCPDGYIYTCPESIGKTELAIGKFYPETIFFEEKINKWMDRSILSMERCSNCSFSPVCGGGCPYSAMLIHGDESEPVCENFKEVLDTYFKHRGEKIIQKFL